MTTLAVPYYGNLYHCSTGYEKVYFIVDYDTTKESPEDVRIDVWDDKQTPELHVWLKEHGVLGVVCRDSESMLLQDHVVSNGITVMGEGSQCARTIMKRLLV